MDTMNKGSQMNMNGVPADLIFGLDIGTRSIVGTVGYKNREGQFIVVAQAIIAHETRAMLDGQIHDIEKVSETIMKVRERLEEMTGRTYQDVCIAAAGRVLKTIEEEAEVDFATETVVTDEHVYSLDMLAVEQAHARLREEEGDEIRFYCVGYSVKQYYQNDYPISNLEGHKCNKVKTELIATFLPDEVVDGLYAAVERAGLNVSNLTLEPIAAINVAIPERFRLLNIALVDVGAGTSDISITRDGSIIAYGMIPAAGDKFTECIAKRYLVDFQEADRLKCDSTLQEEVEFHDIMGLPMTIPSADVAETVKETVQSVAKSIADKIIELNGDKTVSAVFVVGGGGKIHGFIESLAEYLDLPKERVALRGMEVLGGVTFMQEDVQIDSLLVTPIGICMNYYEQRNNFIFVYINDERIRLYDNNNLTVLDAALQVGLPNEVLFAQKGDAVRYTVNGEQRMLRGEPGEAAEIHLNGEITGINTPIDQGDIIEVIPSTKGKEAVMEINQIPEYESILVYYVNGKQVTSPRLVSVNGELVSEYYEIQDGDEIVVLDYYTLEQVLEYMDVTIEGIAEVNNLPATADTKVYENFSVDFVIGDPLMRLDEPVPQDAYAPVENENAEVITSDQNQGISEEISTDDASAGQSGESEGTSTDDVPAGQSGEPEKISTDVPAGQSEEPEKISTDVPAGQSEEPEGTSTDDAVAGQSGVAEGVPADTLAHQNSVPERTSVDVSDGQNSVPDGNRMELSADNQPIEPSVPQSQPTGNSQPVEPPVQQSQQTVSQPTGNSQPVEPPVQQSQQTVSQPAKPIAQPGGATIQSTPQGSDANASANALGNLAITVNGDPVILKGKSKYIMVDVLDFYPVDTAVAHGERLEIKKNGMECTFTEPLAAGDIVLIQWVN